jgi:ATP-binding cassette, subfamily B, multidrug efflux pump
MEEDKIVKGYDPVIMRRLFGFAKPYRKMITVAVITMLVATAAELLGPVLLQKAVDQDIIARYYRADTTTDGQELEDIFPPESLSIFSQEKPPLFEGYRFVPGRMVEKLPSNLRNSLFDSGILDSREWYLSRPSDRELPPEMRDFLDQPEVLQKENWIALPASMLQNLDTAVLRQLREGDIEQLGKKSLIYLLLLVCMLLFSFLQVYLMAYSGQGVMKGLREKLYCHVTGQNLGYLSNIPLGTLVTRVTNDVETINELFTSVATGMLRDIATMAGVVAILFYLDPRLALITSASLPPVFILTAIFRHRARDAYRKVRVWTSRVNAFLSEHISGMDVVQAFRREVLSNRDFQKTSKKLLSADLSEMYVFAIFRPLINLLTSISIGTVLYFSASMILDSALSIGVMIAFVNLLQMFYRPVMNFTENFTILQSAMAGGERIFQLLDEDRTIPDKGKIALPEKLQGRIDFRNIHFSYKEGEPVIKDLSVSIKPGETVAIVGYTGAGKTTIANLLTRLWDIDSGEILIDGIPIQQLSLSDLRSTVVPVQQDVFLFAATIRENITLGKELSDQEVRRAAETVQAAGFIEALPEGYDTVLNERGTNLSTGQRQLLSFARVVAQDPKVIILDEATGSIDTETEKLIQHAMQKLLEGRTSIVIAHRLSTIQHADRILVLSDGRLVEEGSHQELLDQGGVYANLYQLQYRDTGGVQE